ncbi:MULTISPECIES: RICIN domain-containing protein [Streptomyces]|uniref:RICIN domain-containing protein n=1 Tax=Streptomyces lienomycini TaxID=284035 RepID=A0ABV9WWQ0_9ACTN|nr:MULTISPECIES: RICIN domain-containing protein [Streptomyces]
MTAPFAVSAAHAADDDCASPLHCETITSASNGRNLDVQNGSTGDGAFVVTNSAPGHHQSWSLNVDTTSATFTILNDATGKCVDLGWPALSQQTCRGKTSQKWYFQPVAGSHSVFLIRNASDDSCLDLTANAQYDDAWTGTSACHAAANQRWTTTSDAAWNLAVDRGARRCQQDPSSCSWSLASEAPAAPLPTVCASAVWYNNTGSPATQTFSVTETTGWSSSITTALSSSVTGGGGELTPLQATVGTTLTFSNVWNGSTTVGDGIQVVVPDGHYGWVTLSLLARKVTGTWTFDAQGFPWTADDTVTVPVDSDPAGGATVYLANTSPTFTSCA